MDRIGIFIGILLVFWMSSSSSSHKLRPAVGVDRILQDHVHEAFCAFSILHKAESFGIFLEHPFWNISSAGLFWKFVLIETMNSNKYIFSCCFFSNDFVLKPRCFWDYRGLCPDCCDQRSVPQRDVFSCGEWRQDHDASPGPNGGPMVI